jgi:hypothetical protein
MVSSVGYPSKEDKVHMRSAWLSSAVTLVAVALMLGCSREVSYSGDVSPVLKANCIECHKIGGEGHLKSGLAMDSYENLMKGTKFGPVVQPGSSVSSTIMILIEHKADSSINMPHKKDPLPPQQVKLIKRWIDEGAKNN